jgi:hypothetical protein
MIALLDAVGNRGWLPPETMSKDEWAMIIASPDNYSPELVGFAATGPTFGSVWMGSWANDYKTTESWDKYKQARDMAKDNAAGLRGVVFHAMSYEQFNPHILPESIIYCDPPYTKTTSYEGARTNIEIGESLGKNEWRAVAFWRWVDVLVDNGHRVYVSEYSGPPVSTYNVATPAMKAERNAITARFRALQIDSKSRREDRDAVANELKNIDQRIKADAEQRVTRWVSVWEKEVASDFSSVRQENVREAKREVEKLFHRVP